MSRVRKNVNRQEEGPQRSLLPWREELSWFFSAVLMTICIDQTFANVIAHF